MALPLANAAYAGEVRTDTDNYTLNGDIVLAADQRISDSVVLNVHGTLAHKDIRRPAEPALIELATSLQDDGVQSRATGRPIVIFISQENCEYCQLLRSRVLFPMMRAGAFSDIAILRELTLDAGFSLQDFDGVEIAGRVFAERYGVYVTPTLLFLDGGGSGLAEPIIGTSTLDYYEFFLIRAIDEAARALRQ